jgi:hypothetical protein
MTSATRARRSGEKLCNAGSEVGLAAARSVFSCVAALCSVEHALDDSSHIPISTNRFMALPFLKKAL